MAVVNIKETVRKELPVSAKIIMMQYNEFMLVELSSILDNERLNIEIK